jgi:hypothetical protein
MLGVSQINSINREDGVPNEEPFAAISGLAFMDFTYQNRNTVFLPSLHKNVQRNFIDMS